MIAEALHAILDKPVRIEAYDGSTAGPAVDVTLRIRSRKALAHLISAPGELGLARAYVAGELEILAPDHHAALVALAGEHVGNVSMTQRLRALRSLGREALVWVEPPAQEVGAKRFLAGLRAHTLRRDAVAISHHYDVSNAFYEWILGPSMAYTCAVYPTPESTLEDAQRQKFDLVCRKLALGPGMRLLDVGCGWGGMAMHAAEHYGVEVVAVTLSRQQAEWAQKAVADGGLTDLVEIRHQDYRLVRESDFDAVSSIGLTEHIGIANLPAYAATLASKLKPQGRLLNHCITRANHRSSALRPRGFIARYVFPDGELPSVPRLITALQGAGLEVRHEENLREHYAKTLRAWCDNLDRHWDDAVAEVGMATARVWALYLAGSRLGFERNEIQLHQILATRTVDGEAAMPLRPDWDS